MQKKSKIDICKITDAMIRWRWVIALCIFVIALLLRLNMSSIGQFNGLLPTMSSGDKYIELFGQSRPIRQDEWGVQAPTFFSQAYNGYALNSARQSVGGINMVLDYYAPVLSLALIGKPFNWGYVLFGNEIGLSWYWCSFVILLFMVSFEMFWIITKHNKGLSFVGSLLIGLSPAIQWWMMPHMPIVFLYGMALFVIGYYFFTTRSRFFSWLLTILGTIGFVGFALSIFPSIQIIVGIIAMTLLVSCLIRDRDQFSFSFKSVRMLQLCIMVMFTGFVLLDFLVHSKEGLELTMNTVYPGKRISTGGEGRMDALLPTLYSMFLPFKTPNVSNQSELATFIHFGPVILLLYPKIAARLKKENDSTYVIGRSLMILVLVEIVFMCIGFTDLQAKLTLFSYNNRMQISYGFTCAIFTVWGLYCLWKFPDILTKKEKIVYPIVFFVLYATLINADLRAYVGITMLLAEIAVFTLMLFLGMNRYRKSFITLTMVVMLWAGGTVNPICLGIGAITDHPVSDAVQKISEKDPNALWMTTGDRSFVIANFVAANGGRVMNGTNFYPDFEKWKILDPEGEYVDFYNRYANQDVYLTQEKTSFENPSCDALTLKINPKDLLKLDVNTLLSNQPDADQCLEFAGVKYKKYPIQDGYYIYRIG